MANLALALIYRSFVISNTFFAKLNPSPYYIKKLKSSIPIKSTFRVAELLQWKATKKENNFLSKGSLTFRNFDFEVKSDFDFRAIIKLKNLVENKLTRYVFLIKWIQYFAPHPCGIIKNVEYFSLFFYYILRPEKHFQLK